MILARLIGQGIKIRYLWFGLGRSFFCRALPQAAIAEYDLGWDGHNRIYSGPIHLDIRNEKVWIQRNQTNEVSRKKTGFWVSMSVLMIHLGYKQAKKQAGSHDSNPNSNPTSRSFAEKY